MIRLLITDKLSLRIVESLKEIPDFDIVEKTAMTAAELEREIQNCEAVVVRSATRLSADILARADNLRLIVRAGIGLDNVDVDYAKSKNIEVRNTPFATSVTVAEYTLAQMLGICRYIGPAYKSMKEHKWEKGAFSKGTELFGKTAGIVGFGRIGKEVAKRELAMGMNVVFYDILDIDTDIEAKQVSLDELLKTADFISIHLPLSESTRNLISTPEFDKLKKNVVIVNVSRSGIVDEAALLQALREDKVKAVALDVFEENSMNFDLIDNDKVYPAPHLGASTEEGQERAGQDVISILKNFFNV